MSALRGAGGFGFAAAWGLLGALLLASNANGQTVADPSISPASGTERQYLLHHATWQCACYTVTETVPLGLIPSSMTQDAVWNPTDRTLKSENPFKVRAYLNAARTSESLSDPVLKRLA